MDLAANNNPAIENWIKNHEKSVASTSLDHRLLEERGRRSQLKQLLDADRSLDLLK